MAMETTALLPADGRLVGMAWPPNYVATARKRLNALKKAVSSSQEERDALCAYYKTRPVEWINDWCITVDPRIRSPLPRKMPFILFRRQVEFVQFLQSCMDDKESGLVEKARDIGASWLCCAYSIWLWLFWPDSTIGWGSRKEEYVDKKGDPKALFPKMRQIIANLPVWMRPRGYDERVHATYMKILNPANGSVIVGEAGDNMGRGGRTSIYFKDESAHYEHPELIEAALGDNTDVQIDISSVNGTANVFYRRRMAGEVWSPGAEMQRGFTRVFIFDWRDHPGKSQEWYELRRAKADREGLLHVFAQEVDRDYSGSVDKVIIKADWLRACIDAHIKLGIENSGMRVAGQDIADGGIDKNALGIMDGIVLVYADHWGGEAGDAAVRAVPVCMEYQVDELYYDSIGVGSGFKTKINDMREQDNWPSRLGVIPWSAAAGVLDPTGNVIMGDPESPLNEDQYYNLKAQAWFRLRTRVYKTYRAVVFGDAIQPEEVFSISSELPRRFEVIMELAQAIWTKTATGKVVVDKTPPGSSSPNLADAIVMANCPTHEGLAMWMGLIDN